MGDGGWVCLVDCYCGRCVEGADLVVGMFVFGRGICGRHCNLIVKLRKWYIDREYDQRQLGDIYK